MVGDELVVFKLWAGYKAGLRLELMIDDVRDFRSPREPRVYVRVRDKVDRKATADLVCYIGLGVG